MGEVYRTKDTKLHREIAIKVLLADVASSPDRMNLSERDAYGEQREPTSFTVAVL